MNAASNPKTELAQLLLAGLEAQANGQLSELQFNTLLQTCRDGAAAAAPNANAAPAGGAAPAAVALSAADASPKLGTNVDDGGINIPDGGGEDREVVIQDKAKCLKKSAAADTPADDGADAVPRGAAPTNEVDDSMDIDVSRGNDERMRALETVAAWAGTSPPVGEDALRAAAQVTDALGFTAHAATLRHHASYDEPLIDSLWKNIVAAVRADQLKLNLLKRPSPETEAETVQKMGPAEIPPEKKPKVVPAMFTPRRSLTGNPLPEPADLARQRRDSVEIRKRIPNPNKAGRGPSQHINGGRKTDVSRPTVLKRVEQYTDQGICEKPKGSLWCNPCKCPVGSGAIQTKAHVDTMKHRNNKIAFHASGDDQSRLRAGIVQFIAKNSTEEMRVVGMERVSVSLATFRARTLEAFIACGTPVAKIDRLRPFLEDISDQSLAHSNHLMISYMPILVEKEKETLLVEFGDVESTLFGVYHDGTTYGGEAFCVVVRWVDKHMSIHLRCVAVDILKKTLTGEQICSQLCDVLARKLGIPLSNVLAWMNDAASANSCAFSKGLKTFAAHSDQLFCLGHTLNNAAEKAAQPVLDEFLLSYNAAVSKSATARTSFKEVNLLPCLQLCNTRWTGEMETCARSLLPAHSAGTLKLWPGDLRKRNCCEKTTPKLEAFFADERKNVLLGVELAVIVTHGGCIAELLTKVQGDGWEIATMYEDVVALVPQLNAPFSAKVVTAFERAAASAPAIPIVAPKAAEPVAEPDVPKVPARKSNRGATMASREAPTTAVAAAGGRRAPKEPPADPVDKTSDEYLSMYGLLNDPCALAAYGRTVIAPVIEYFVKKVVGNGARDSNLVSMMRAASYFDPVRAMVPSEDSVDALWDAFAFLSKHPTYDDMKDPVKAEVPMFATLRAAIPSLEVRLEKGKDTFSIGDWWKNAALKLPKTAIVLRGVLTHAINSAPPERVFSILNDSFDADQKRSLNDYVELSLMLQYNLRDRVR